MAEKKVTEKEAVDKPKTPYVYFNNCKNTGDHIEALVKYFLKFDFLNEFILESALKDVRAFNQKVDAYKQELLK